VACLRHRPCEVFSCLATAQHKKFKLVYFGHVSLLIFLSIPENLSPAMLLHDRKPSVRSTSRDSVHQAILDVLPQFFIAFEQKSSEAF
jgi:hypothetical protein